MNTLLLLAQAATDAPPQAPNAGLGAFLPMILIIAIFYFLMIRPQQRKEKERREQVSALRAGAKILFCGGMIGTISEVRDATFLVEVSKGVVVEVAKGAVERPLPDKPEEPAKK